MKDMRNHMHSVINSIKFKHFGFGYRYYVLYTSTAIGFLNIIIGYE